jgi:integrase
VARLRGEHVDHAGGTLVVHGKGGHVDTLPLPPSVARLVPPGTRGPVVGLSADSVAAHVVRAMRRAGVHGRTSHALRRTYATRLMRDGASAVDVMRLLRHSSLATTTSYVRSAIDV